jgi:hypothetical protein
MTTGGGFAGSSERDVIELTTDVTELRTEMTTKLAEDGVSRRASTTHVSHLRIVYSADRPAGFTQPLHNRPRPMPDRPADEDGTNGGSDTQVKLDRAIQGQIGSMLRDVFADVASEPVPPRFVELLDALAAQEKQR